MQLVFNAMLYSAIAAGLFLWLTSLLKTKGQMLAWVIAVLVGFVPPHSLENTLSGFHSQQYFLIAVSLFAIERTLRCRENSAGWWVGLFAMAVALFTMGSGLLASVATMIMVLITAWVSGQPKTIRWRTLLGCGAICLLGSATMQSAPLHAPLHAHNAAEFLGTMRRAIAWPLSENWLFLVLSFAPTLWLAVVSIRRRLSGTTKEMVLLAFSGWIVLQLLATAYARGAGGGNPSSRYLDTLVVSLVLNLASGLVLWAQRPAGGRTGAPLLALLSVWSGFVGVGLALHHRALFRIDFPERIRALRACEHNIRLYLFTGNVAWLKRDDQPYPGVDELIERLGHPEIRALLPASVGEPVWLTPTGAEGFSAGAISGDCTPFLYAAARGSYPATRTGTWSSSPVTPSHAGYLKFELAGDTDASDVSLELRSAASGAVLATVKPSKRAGDHWRAAYVRMPQEPYRVVARDTNVEAWLAFSDPVYMSGFSHACWRVVENAPLLFGLSISWMAIVVVAGCTFSLEKRDLIA